MKRFIEMREDGLSTGRVLYYVKGDLPEPAKACSWKADGNFKIEEDSTHDPDKLKYYGTALTEGYAIANL
jgi:hypothetical protein